MLGVITPSISGESKSILYKIPLLAKGEEPSAVNPVRVCIPAVTTLSKGVTFAVVFEFEKVSILTLAVSLFPDAVSS